MVKGKKTLKIRAQAKKFTFKYEGVEQPKGAVGKYYPAEDVVLKKGPTPVRNAPKLRSTITPGTVLIVLAGRFRGKRVVFLKQLSSGLLLVSGPYALNGVPLRRVNQRYVIATSTKINVAGVNVSKIDDAFFAREKVTKKAGDVFDADEKKETVISAERKAEQTAVDNALVASIKKDSHLEAYIRARFSLRKSDKPHAMLF